MTPQEKQQLDAANARMKMSLEQKAAWFDVLVGHHLTVTKLEDSWTVSAIDEDEHASGASLLGAVQKLCENAIASSVATDRAEYWKGLQGRVFGLVEPDGSFDLKCECCDAKAIGVATVAGNIKHALCQQCGDAGIMPMKTLKLALKGAKREDISGWTEKQVKNTCNQFGKSVDEFWGEMNA